MNSFNLTVKGGESRARDYSIYIRCLQMLTKRAVILKGNGKLQELDSPSKEDINLQSGSSGRFLTKYRMLDWWVGYLAQLRLSFLNTIKKKAVESTAFF